MCLLLVSNFALAAEKLTDFDQEVREIAENCREEVTLSDRWRPMAAEKYNRCRLRLGLAAYNAGPSRVSPKGILVYVPETQNYITKVLLEYRRLAGSGK